MNPWLDRWVGRVALLVTFALVVLALGLVTTLASPRLRGWLGSSPRHLTSYAVGQQIDVPASVYHGVPFTVILFARSTCPACQRAKPFLGHLVRTLSSTGRVQVVLIASAGLSDAEIAFGRELGIDQTKILAPNARPLRFRRVPAIVAVDSDGRVVYSYEGSPIAGSESLVQTAILAATSPGPS